MPRTTRPRRSRPAPSSPLVHSTVFRSGNSQAVRIPVDLRLDCTEVTIRREGPALIIEPVTETGWPAGYFTAFEDGSTLERPVQPKMLAARRLDK